jgi:hypothetical protein
MVDWKSWVKAGVWERIDGHALTIDLEVIELQDLAALLTEVVPIVPANEAGTGLVDRSRRATPRDRAFLDRHADSGQYEKAMQRVRETLGDIPLPERPVQFSGKMTATALQKHFAGRVSGGDLAAFQRRQLRYAAMCLEIMENSDEGEIVSQDSWLVEAEEVALKALDELGVKFAGFDEAIIFTSGDGHPMPRNEALDATEKTHTISLAQLMRDESRLTGAKMWHCARAIFYINAFKRGVDVARLSSADGPWETSEVEWLALECGSLAIQIGHHIQAIETEWIDRLAERTVKADSKRKKAVAARTEQFADATPAILSSMRELVERGESISNAARITREVRHLGKSTDANRRLFTRHKKPGTGR